jgi:hypothetical protein
MTHSANLPPQTQKPKGRYALLCRFTGSLCLCGFLLLSQAAADDPVSGQPEPPVRLKKKAKPRPEVPPESKKESPEKKPAAAKKPESKDPAEDVKDNAEADAQELEHKIKELMSRLGKNLHEAEDRLTKKDPSDATQQVQRDIVKDLEDLIEQTKRQQQQQQQQSSSSSSSSQQKNQQARRNRTQKNRANAQRPQPQPDRQANEQNGNDPRGGASPRGEMSRIADLYKDIWGHLPETLRQEMNQYSREQFMAKYNELLKQYYATIAEKGRRKGEQ